MTQRRPLLFVGAFTAGLAIGTFVPVLRAARAEGTGGSVYEQLKLFSRVFDLVRKDYVFKEPSKKLVYNAINGMLTGLDPHSDFMNERQYRDFRGTTTGEFGGLGMAVTERTGKLVVVSTIRGTPAAKAGVKAGDVIAEIDGRPTVGLSLQHAVEELRGSVGSTVDLTLTPPHRAAAINVTLTRALIRVDPVKSRLFGNIGYIRLSTFSDHANNALRKAVRSLDREDHDRIAALILDLRNNPGGLLDQGVAVANDFLNTGEIVATHGRHKSDDHIWYAHRGDILHGKPLVVMINAGTASAAEIVTAALQQNHRAVVLGVRSFGKGSVQTIFPVRGYGAVRMTTALYYTPSGKSLQDYGVRPDIVVHESPNAHGYANVVRDASLAHAIHNPTGMHGPIAPPKASLPPIARRIASRPPEGWPRRIQGNPSTDYQLQMAFKLARAMAGLPPKGSTIASLKGKD